MVNKEKNFISAVVYLHNDEETVLPFFIALKEQLDLHFETYEMIAVNDACTDRTIIRLREWAKEFDRPLTILNMSSYHGKEDAMNAGVDCAIGDFVYEFDTMQMPYQKELIFKVYQLALEGNDIVFAGPDQLQASSRFFYRIFNRNSRSNYKLQTDAFHLVSRRAINRVHSSSAYLPYRKASYAASGLKIASVTFVGKLNDRNKGRGEIAINSLALYTNAGYRISIAFTFLMMLMVLAEMVYTVVIYCTGRPIEGWTTQMIAITLGFFGLFLIMSLVIKYLSLNLDMLFRKQKYLIESIEKIQK